MTIRSAALAASLALGLAYAPGAAAMNLQPGMLTMMQQGGQEHGVQQGCALPGYDARRTCSSYLNRASSAGVPVRRNGVRSWR